MKILQVCNGYPPKDTGGIQEYVYSISHLFQEKNEVWVFTRECNLEKNNYTEWILKDGKINIISVVNNNVCPQNFVGSYINEKVNVFFKKVIQEFQPDIIHFNHLIGLSSNLPTIAKKNNIPFLFTLHDFWYICTCTRLIAPSGEICRGSNPDCVKDYFQQNPKVLSILFEKSPLIIKKLIPSFILSEIKSVFAKIYILGKKNSVDMLSIKRLAEVRKNHFKKILNTPSIFIAPSKYIREKYIDFGINPKKILLLPHGINLKNIKHNLYRKKNQRIRFVYLGTLAEYKGVHILIEAFNNIEDKNVELKVYGDTTIDPAYFRRLKKISNRKNIYFMGGYKHSDLNKIFSSVDVLIIPSIVPESFSLVAHEAQAAGIPIIASKIGALPEVINHGMNGLLFIPGDIKELAEMIKMMIDSPTLISKFSSNSKIPLDIESHVSKLLDIYSKVLTKER